MHSRDSSLAAASDIDSIVAAFIRRWQLSRAAERANFQSFLNELCDLLHVPRPDPTRQDDRDIRIQVETSAGGMRNKLAIEIKGGTDNSNAHNRAGEAEKSHVKARKLDFRDCWTIIAMKGLDAEKLRAESPTTNSWFDIAQVLGRVGPDWDEFRSRLADAVGVPLADQP